MFATSKLANVIYFTKRSRFFAIESWLFGALRCLSISSVCSCKFSRWFDVRRGTVCELLSIYIYCVERGSSAVECQTRNQVSPSSNPLLLPFRRLGMFVLSIDAPVDSAV